MNRLTEKVRYERYHKELQELRDSVKRNPSSLNCAYDTLSAIKTYEPFKLVYEKLSQYEDIDEKFGIDLITMFKALEQDYVYYKNDKVCVRGINTRGLIVFDEGFGWGECDYTLSWKDYGKTWGLSREELENE